MEYRRCTLVVITFLQLCQAEHYVPQWYSAKLNDDFQPKPISEIFSTEPAFSTANPIVVTNSISDDINLLSSTLSPPTIYSESTKLSQFPSTPTTGTPAGALYQMQLDQFKSQIDILPQAILQPNMPSYIPLVDLVSNVPELTEPGQVSETPQVTNRVNVQPLTYTQGPKSTFQVQTAESKPASTQQPITFADPQQSFRPPNQNPNYIVIYQQAPPFPTFPPSSQGTSEVTIRESRPTTVTLPPRTSEASTTRPFPTTFPTTSTLPTTLFSTPWPIDRTSTLGSSSVTITPSSTLGLSNGGFVTSTTRPPVFKNEIFPGLGYPIKIRVIAPTGSITNVNINPLTTTKRPETRKTTRKPTTRRTSKPKKNNYERCLDGCRKVKDPICAAPLSHVTLDANMLKGFPSVCHMACHNSYRKDPFEKVIDGSCSKLRTRIRLIDSKSKLKKDELRKNEYSLDDGKTVIEFSGLA